MYFHASTLHTQLRREKIDLENTLEQEQEMLVNRLWKRMDKVEAEKRCVCMCVCVCVCLCICTYVTVLYSCSIL